MTIILAIRLWINGGYMRKINKKNNAITPINLSICDLMVSNGTLPYVLLDNVQ